MATCLKRKPRSVEGWREIAQKCQRAYAGVWKLACEVGEVPRMRATTVDILMRKKYRLYGAMELIENAIVEQFPEMDDVVITFVHGEPEPRRPLAPLPRPSARPWNEARRAELHHSVAAWSEAVTGIADDLEATAGCRKIAARFHAIADVDKIHEALDRIP